MVFFCLFLEFMRSFGNVFDICTITSTYNLGYSLTLTIYADIFWMCCVCNELILCVDDLVGKLLLCVKVRNNKQVMMPEHRRVYRCVPQTLTTTEAPIYYCDAGFNFAHSEVM